MSNRISIIVIVNNEEIYHGFLENLNQQDFKDYELIAINNYNHEFNSATKAFNKYIKEAKNELLMFVHPDIRFLKTDSLSQIVQSVNELKEFGIVGVAGAKKGENGERVIITNIVHGSKKEIAGYPLIKPEEVQTLDECLFLIRKDYLKKVKFKERDSWHLYAVEYCLNALSNGDKVYVIPANVWHMSNGKSLDYHYMLDLMTMAKEYRDQFQVLYTTVKKWTLKGISGYIYIRYYLLKQIVKKIIKRG